jgi:hypothetical protein
MLSCSISCRDLIKFPYFADSTRRGDSRGERENDFMDNFIIWTKNGYEFSSIEREEGYIFSSIYKKVMKLFIHSHEGYGVAFKPLNRRLCIVTSSRTLVIDNNSHLSYFGQLASSCWLCEITACNERGLFDEREEACFSAVRFYGRDAGCVLTIKV